MTEKTDIRDSDEKVVEIEMERLRNFTNHPFKVIGDSQMIELQDSIKKYGVLNPLIVRPRKEGYYEIISGHRRKYAAERLGYKKIPVIIRMMQDDEAVVTMVDSNLQREQITPSEKAYAYKMKYDAIKKKAGRKNCGQVDHNTGKRSIDVIGELCGDSAKQVQRYIKMTELIPALLDKVDDGSMGFTPAVQLSYLKKKEQQEIIDAMEATQCTPSLSQAIRIKKLSEAGKLTESEAEGILGEIKQKEADRVVFKNEQLYRFFPSQRKNNKTVRVLKTPKTDTSERKVYIPGFVAQCLIDIKKEQDEVKEALGSEYTDYNLIMATIFGMPINGSYIRDQMQKVIDKEGLPDVVFHSLRHTSVTYKLKLSGGDIKAVQGDSGHAQADMVTEVYGHIIDEDRRKNAERMENAFYNKENLNPDIHEKNGEENKITIPEGVDPELLMKVLGNPEMAALLTSLAKTMKV